MRENHHEIVFPGNPPLLVGIPKWSLLKAAALASAGCGGVSVALGSLAMCVMFVTVAWCMLWRLE